MANGRRRRRLPSIHPGEILLEEYLRPFGISINKLARDIDVPPGRVSLIVNGKRGITADTALRLAKYFRVSAELWMRLQSECDLRVAQRKLSDEIDKSVRPHVA